MVTQFTSTNKKNQSSLTIILKMKKLFLLLLIAAMPVCVSAINLNLKVDTLKVDTLQFNNDQAFNLCYNSLEYWWMYAKIQDSIIMQQKHMIDKYIVVTGVQSQKAEDVESLYNLKQQISLDEQQEKLNKETVRKKRWRNISIATASAVILESAVIYFLVR
jgi:hypothetical protein